MYIHTYITSQILLSLLSLSWHGRKKEGFLFYTLNSNVILSYNFILFVFLDFPLPLSCMEKGNDLAKLQ
jgi:hypothetical protein